MAVYLLERMSDEYGVRDLYRCLIDVNLVEDSKVLLKKHVNQIGAINNVEIDQVKLNRVVEDLADVFNFYDTIYHDLFTEQNLQLFHTQDFKVRITGGIILYVYTIVTESDIWRIEAKYDFIKLFNALTELKARGFTCVKWAYLKGTEVLSVMDFKDDINPKINNKYYDMEVTYSTLKNRIKYKIITCLTNDKVITNNKSVMSIDNYVEEYWYLFDDVGEVLSDFIARRQIILGTNDDNSRVNNTSILTTDGRFRTERLVEMDIFKNKLFKNIREEFKMNYNI